MNRLKFVLPDFTRVVWASDLARAVWAARVTRLTAAHAATEQHSVVRRIRSCALIDIAPGALVRSRRDGLRVIPLARNATSRYEYSSSSASASQGEPFVWRAVVGRPRDAQRFRRAWEANDMDGVGSLLGYPACCRDFFARTWIRSSFVDTTWPMAMAAAETPESKVEIAVRGPWQANILWRWAGVRAVPHLPCRFDCGETVRFADALSHCAREAGFGEEMSWLEDVLSWPVQWTALHGIAEIETPILKMAARTDATGSKYTVRREGDRYPAEGVVGLRFPYRSARRPLPVVMTTRRTDEVLGNHFDNGFSSQTAMRTAHAPVVALARWALDGKAGAVVDLGCGNGELVRAICDGRTQLAPMGIDRDASRIARARASTPEFTKGFLSGELLDAESLLPRHRYALAIVMPERLLEVDRGRAQELRRWLRCNCDRVLVYGYGDVLSRHRGLQALSRKAGLPYASIDPAASAALIAWRRSARVAIKEHV